MLLHQTCNEITYFYGCQVTLVACWPGYATEIPDLGSTLPLAGCKMDPAGHQEAFDADD